MGIFNWAMKGVNMERREATTANTIVLEQPEVTAIEPTSDNQPQFQSEDLSARANSVLFGDNGNYTTESPQPTQYNSYSPQYSAPTPQYSAPTQYGTTSGFSSAFSGQTLGNRNILVVTPRTTQEVSGIVEHLRSGEACIVCLDGIPVSDAQRRIDFLSGVVCAINGIIRPLDANKYILTPSGVGVKN